MTALSRRSWPGNVRELRNAVEHAAILARQEVLQPEHLPQQQLLSTVGSAPSKIEDIESMTAFITEWTNQQANDLSGKNAATWHDDLLALVEPPLIRSALIAAGGHRAKAADLLGWHRGTLREKLRKYGLEE